MDIYAVGGYGEVGKNMTVVDFGNEAVVLDMGFYLPELINYEETKGGVKKNDLNASQMVNIGAIPDIRSIKHIKDKVRAIVAGHCHLDHIGAIPYLESNFNANIMGTPYTVEVLKALIKDNGRKLRNRIKVVSPNSVIGVGGLKVELINMTHSTPQSAMIHVSDGKDSVIYANDFKFDNYPGLGKKPNYARLKQLGKKGVKVLIVESLYAHEDRKTPSEKVAKEMLKDVLLGVNNSNNAIIVTTFASHIARLKSILELGVRLGRRVVFVGRSMHKYIKAAEDINLINFSESSNVLSYKSRINKVMRDASKHRDRYLIVCTGNQGEPGAVLSRMADDDFPFKIEAGDNIIFSSSVIPAEQNIDNRRELEDKLKAKNARVFKDIHVSGHAGRQDLMDLIEMVSPEYVMPAHGGSDKLKALAEICLQMGYSKNKILIPKGDGDKLSV